MAGTDRDCRSHVGPMSVPCRSHVGMSPMVVMLFETNATVIEQVVRTHASDHAVLSALSPIHGPRL